MNQATFSTRLRFTKEELALPREEWRRLANDRICAGLNEIDRQMTVFARDTYTRTHDDRAS